MPVDYKVYSRHEEILNAATHFAGIIASVAGTVYMLMCRQILNSALTMAAVLFYGMSLVVMFSVSTVYHSTTSPEKRQFWQHFDHCAIYFLISGSYAPLLCMVARDIAGGVIFTLLIIGSITGCAARIAGFRYLRKLEIFLYVIMGWCCVAIAGKLIDRLPELSLWLLLVGGVAYTGGIFFYVRRQNFCHAIWHVFVLAGAALQFFAISTALDL